MHYDTTRAARLVELTRLVQSFIVVVASCDLQWPTHRHERVRIAHRPWLCVDASAANTRIETDLRANFQIFESRLVAT